MGEPVKKFNEHYTFADYKTWPDNSVDTIVQPDISIFCDDKKLDDQGAVGAPDLVVEILSPSTAVKDLREKFYLYEKVGVREYWIVDPANETLTVYIPDKNGKYPIGKIYAGQDRVTVGLFEDLEVKMVDENTILTFSRKDLIEEWAFPEENLI